jgi:hypothetical protein
MNKQNRNNPESDRQGHQWIYNLLNIKAGEGKPVLLLILFSFFIGLALTFYFTASNAIFIKHFEPRMISISFIVSGLAVYLSWLLLTQIDRRLPISARFIVKFILVLLSVIAISIGTWLNDSDTMAFILFTFVRVLVYISLVTFWGLAGKLFNLRQGKRIFGLIGAGEVISIIIGYFSVPVVLNFIKTPSLLFISSTALFICFLIVLLITRKFKKEIQASEGNTSAVPDQDKKQWRYSSLVRKPYFSLISVMALLPIFGYLFVDFMFLRQTKFEFQNDQETIARFFGYVLGFVAVVELIFKMFVSGRLLNKYGLKPSMLTLPLSLLLSTAMAAIFGILYGPAGIFFAFIVFSRLLERSIRGAIYEPAFQLLYQPVPSEQRLAFQSQIEGIPKALGTIFTGGILLLFSIIPGLNLVHYNFFFLLVIGIWIFYAIRMYRAYRGRIQEILSTQKAGIDETTVVASERSISMIFQAILDKGAIHFKRLFRLIDEIEPVKATQILLELLKRAPVPVKTEILRYIEQKQVIAAREALSDLAQNPRDKELASLIDSALVEIRMAETYSIDLLSNLARSGDAEEREVAARLLAHSPRYQTIKILSDLLRDHHPAVRKTALVTSGKVKRIELWPRIVENLRFHEYRYTAFSAIKNIGEPIINELEDLFRKTGNNIAAQVLIIRLYGQIGGERALGFLRTKINYPDIDIQMEVLTALSLLNYKAHHQEKVLVKQTIERTIETMVWIMASLQDISEDIRTTYLQNSLQTELSEKKEQIFLLLSLIYDAPTIRLIRKNIESGNTQSKIFALEVSDMTVSGEIKEVLLPIFDDISIQERLALFRFRFPQQKLDLLERCIDIINKDYNLIRKWTKACAIELLIHFEKEVSTEVLRANLVNPSGMISETAAWVLHSKDQEQFFDVLAVQRPENKLKLEPVTKKLGLDKTFIEKLLITEKTESLKIHGMFNGLPDHLLAEIALTSEDVTLGQNQLIPFDSSGRSSLGVLLSGQIIAGPSRKPSRIYKSGDILFMDPDGSVTKDEGFTATEQSILIRIDMDLILGLIREYPYFTKRFLEWYIIN